MFRSLLPAATRHELHRHRQRLGWLPASLAWLACAPFHAGGQPFTAPSADPGDSRAAVPALRYRSTLAPGTSAPAPAEAPRWREANHTAARVGGWRAYLREAQTPAAASPDAPASGTPPAERRP